MKVVVPKSSTDIRRLGDCTLSAPKFLPLLVTALAGPDDDDGRSHVSPAGTRKEKRPQDIAVRSQREAFLINNSRPRRWGPAAAASTASRSCSRLHA